MINQVLLLFSIIIFISTLMIILSINPIHSIYWLVFIFLLASISLIFIGYSFLGFMLIIIYIGAITILFLFVIMMVDVLEIRIPTKISHMIFTIIMISSLISFNYISIFKKFYVEKNNLIINTWESQTFNHLDIIGLLVYNSYFISFIILSLILLIGLMSAIILTLDINLNSKKQSLYKQHQRNNSWT